jgi:hypothetical protein
MLEQLRYNVYRMFSPTVMKLMAEALPLEVALRTLDHDPNVVAVLREYPPSREEMALVCVLNSTIYVFVKHNLTGTEQLCYDPQDCLISTEDAQYARYIAEELTDSLCEGQNEFVISAAVPRAIWGRSDD